MSGRWVDGRAAMDSMRGAGTEARLGENTETFLHEPPKRSRDLCIMACTFCRTPLFWRWLETLAAQAGVTSTFDEAKAKDFILSICSVASRNELDTDADAARAFHKMVREPFNEWKEAQHGDR